MKNETSDKEMLPRPGLLASRLRGMAYATPLLAENERTLLLQSAIDAEQLEKALYSPSATLTIEDAVLALLKLQKLPHDPRLHLPPNEQAYNDALRDAEHAIRSYVGEKK